MTAPPPAAALTPAAPPVRTRGEVEARLAALTPRLRALGVERVRLFGSFVRDEQREDSDVDLLADLRPGITLIGLGRILNLVEPELGRAVDLVPAAGLNPHFGPHILSEAEDVALTR